MRRVDEAVRAVLSDAIAKDLQDPRVGFVTVTGVKTSPDLRHARVYVSVLGDAEARSESLAGLQSAHGFLQSRVASELRLKHTPMLQFGYDESVDRAMRLTELMQEGSRQDPHRTGGELGAAESAREDVEGEQSGGEEAEREDFEGEQSGGEEAQGEDCEGEWPKGEEFEGDG